MSGAYLINNVHFLISLLCLEGIILSIVIILPSQIADRRIHVPSVTLIILTLGACEARLGLRLLVKAARTVGTDLISNQTKNKC